jgi:hypothetical protein
MRLDQLAGSCGAECPPRKTNGLRRASCHERLAPTEHHGVPHKSWTSTSYFDGWR